MLDVDVVSVVVEVLYKNFWLIDKYYIHYIMF